MLDPERFSNPAAYLNGDLYTRLVEVQLECNITRQALATARLNYHQQVDQVRLMRWEESVAAQNRAVDIECRLQWNVMEQTEADWEQLRQERESC